MSQEKVKGISFNESVFQGRVAEEPIIGPNTAFLKLRTTIVEQGANNQFTESVQEVPLLAVDKNKIKTIASYVKKGKQLYVKAYYKTWTDNNGNPQHAHIVTHISLGPDEAFKGAGSGGYNNQRGGVGAPGGYPG